MLYIETKKKISLTKKKNFSHKKFSQVLVVFSGSAPYHFSGMKHISLDSASKVTSIGIFLLSSKTFHQSYWHKKFRKLYEQHLSVSCSTTTHIQKTNYISLNSAQKVTHNDMFFRSSKYSTVTEIWQKQEKTKNSIKFLLLVEFIVCLLQF